MDKEEIRETLNHLSKEELLEMIIEMYISAEEISNLYLTEIGENGLH